MIGSFIRAVAYTVVFIAPGVVVAAGVPAWPARPVRIIVPFPPGGGTDIVTRLFAQKLADQLGASFVVDNRPGGAGTLGAGLVAEAAPDGYTLLTSATEFSINPSVRPNLRYDPLKSFTPISQLTSGQYMLASHPSVPVRTVRQLIMLAKARPGQLNYGSSGTGSINHLAGQLLQTMAGIRWVHVPFKGTGPAMIGLISGEVDFIFAGTAPLVPQVRAGKVRAIAVTGPTRYSAFPNVPTIGESGVPNYNVTGWYGFYAPAGTPPEIVNRLHAELRRALKNADIQQTLAKTGNEPVVSSPDEFTAFLRAEVAKWAKVVKAIKLRID